MDRFIAFTATALLKLMFNLKSSMDRFIGIDAKNNIETVLFKIQYG